MDFESTQLEYCDETTTATTTILLIQGKNISIYNKG